MTPNLTPEETNSDSIDYGSQNVFADLGLDNADELYTRSQLGMQIFLILKEREYKQAEASQVLGIAQSEVSALCSGKFSRFSTDRLISFLNKLNWKVEIALSPCVSGESLQSVSVPS